METQYFGGLHQQQKKEGTSHRVKGKQRRIGRSKSRKGTYRTPSAKMISKKNEKKGTTGNQNT